MKLSPAAKTVLALSVLAGLTVFLIVLDFGVYAGRIHHGVRVQESELGYLTEEEASEVLDERSEQLLGAPVQFVTEGTECEFYGWEAGWTPYPRETAREAFEVGREGAFLTALRQRVSAWFGGAKVKWQGRKSVRQAVELVDACEERVAALGLELRRYKLRRKIWRAIQTYPRRPFRIPVRAT